MGYAIFTARKLMLTNRINQLNARLMQLMQQQQTLADSAAQREMARNSQKSLFQTIGNIFQSGLTMQQNALQQAAYQKLQSEGMDNSEYQQYMSQLYQGGVTGAFNLMNTPLGIQINMMSQILDNQAQSEQRQVKDMENQIELQKKSIETQLAAAQAELKKVEDAESKQIEASAPKYA